MTTLTRFRPAKVSRTQGADVLLGEDWVSPETLADELPREGRGIVALNRSPLARKILVFNLVALVILVVGVLSLNSSRESLVTQNQRALQEEARLTARLFEADIPAPPEATPEAAPEKSTRSKAKAPPPPPPPEVIDLTRTLTRITPSPGTSVFVFDPVGSLIGSATGADPIATAGRSPTFITGFLRLVWIALTFPFGAGDPDPAPADPRELALALYPAALKGATKAETTRDAATDATIISVATPILRGSEVLGVVALTGSSTEIDQLARLEREHVLQMFVIAICVSVGFSILLASTIANPLADLAAAAELGRTHDSHRLMPRRVRIPDLSARPDEIGRLSVSLRGLVAALYDRIDANEQFAADVAHEIKNPLASLRSAVGTMRVARREDQRDRLLDLIEHDVRRLDRLVSDISNASRLDSELVKEEESTFDLLQTVSNLSDYLREQAALKGVDLVSDLPPEPIMTVGLEARLAQVFVNIISNAISFCEDGDAVRIWVRRRENRVLVVVEDTGPGIPDAALGKIFKRFYSERPERQFGNHSGLGLAISRQIVEAHGGVIWAENIRAADADTTSPPLGARFVVGLPI